MTESPGIGYMPHVVTALSTERLAPYVRTTNGDLAETLRRYELNLTVPGAFDEAIGILEVVLRNALGEQLAASITFLLSKDSVNINGAIAASDGGWSAV